MQDLFSCFFSQYTWYIAIVHFLAAIILFYIINWIGAKSISVGYIQMSIVVEEESYPAFNFLFKAIAPVIIMILYVALAQAVHLESFTSHCYLIVVYYWLFRISVVILYRRGSLTNWTTQLFYWITSIGLSIYVYKLVDKVDKILPDPDSLRDEMWILIILFLYSTFNKMTFDRKGTLKRKEKYLKETYTRLKSRYNKVISKECDNYFFTQVIYAIMIYENFNRPQIVRWIEYICFWLTKKTHTLGIMQVKSSKWITNEQSIILAINKVKSDCNSIINGFVNDIGGFYLTDVVGKIAGKYNKSDDYVDEVEQIFFTISDTENASYDLCEEYKRFRLEYNESYYFESK